MVGRVISMQKSGTEAIRTQIQPSKPKREITNYTNIAKKTASKHFGKTFVNNVEISRVTNQ